MPKHPGCDSHPSPDISHVNEEAMLAMSDSVEMMQGNNEELSWQSEQRP